MCAQACAQHGSRAPLPHPPTYSWAEHTPGALEELSEGPEIRPRACGRRVHLQCQMTLGLLPGKGAADARGPEAALRVGLILLSPICLQWSMPPVELLKSPVSVSKSGLPRPMGGWAGQVQAGGGGFRIEIGRTLRGCAGSG